jgi:regulator of cell morphogenesis and NO signaling
MQVSIDQLVSEVAAQSPGAIRVFERHRIDYCCGGRKPIAEACAEIGIDPAVLARELGAAASSPSERDPDWTTAPLRDLTAHIVNRHHGFLRRELPRLADRLEKVMSVYGDKDRATLAPLPALLASLDAELDLHMRKEERMLFPYIESLEAARETGRPVPAAPFGAVANPIAMMEDEHDAAGDLLRRMREATDGYAIPSHACITYRALFGGLRELEQDLHLHIHLENNILFPRTLALESA